MSFGKRGQSSNEVIELDEADDAEGGMALSRWLPTAVVLFAVGGFISLAWYAYHTGTQSVSEDDLVVVEADKTPMKEKPLDPGGMKFMNQDKTIYDTFSSQQANPPKVEHVMPAPEEPIAKPAAASDTKTWVNDSLHQDAAPAKNSEALMAEEKQKVITGQATVKPVDTARKTEDSGITTHVADLAKAPEEKAAESKPEEKKPQAAAVAPAAKPVALSKTEDKPVKTTPAVNKAEAAKSSGSVKIQLGAYGSESEAKSAWEKIQKKFPELSGKTVYVVKADLGAKGVFYRLRAGGIADAAAAKALCAKLSAKGQACLVP